MREWFAEFTADNRSPWLWLFPISAAIHVLEEGLAGERFNVWTSHVIGRVVDAKQLWCINAALLTAMVIVVVLLRHAHIGIWVVPGLGCLVVVNAMTHLVGTFVSDHYSPGVVSGMLLWVPLGGFALIRSRQTMPRSEWRVGVAAGFMLQVAIGIVALSVSSRG